MRRACCLAFMLMTVVSPAFAAPAPAPTLSALDVVPGGFLLLLWGNTQVQIQEELKLSKDQVLRIEELKGDRDKAIQGLSRAEQQKILRERSKADLEALAKVLTQKQLSRLAQIALQRMTPFVTFHLPKVAEALKLTDDQKAKIDLIRKDFPQELSTPRGGGGAELMQKQREWRKSQEERILNVLTPAQKSKWNLLLGAPVKLEPRKSEK